MAITSVQCYESVHKAANAILIPWSILLNNLLGHKCIITWNFLCTKKKSPQLRPISSDKTPPNKENLCHQQHRYPASSVLLVFFFLVSFSAAGFFWLEAFADAGLLLTLSPAKRSNMFMSLVSSPSSSSSSLEPPKGERVSSSSPSSRLPLCFLPFSGSFSVLGFFFFCLASASLEDESSAESLYLGGRT